MELLEELLQKITLPERKGVYTFGRLQIHYDLYAPTSKDIDEQQLAVNFITAYPVEEKDIDVTVLVHTAVPEIFQEIVTFHEIIESYFRFICNKDTKEAHKATIPYEEEYAARYFSKRWQMKYAEWRKKVTTR